MGGVGVEGGNVGLDVGKMHKKEAEWIDAFRYVVSTSFKDHVSSYLLRKTLMGLRC